MCPASVTGIIPARAGFTSRRAPCPTPPTDHPRSRGVYDDSVGGVEEGDRIIPARAGFTAGTTTRGGGGGDHPRSRGVYGEVGIRRHRRQGSSPLARGLPTWRPRPSRPSKDHPRSRGVYIEQAITIANDRGSSPLARGLRGGTVEVTVQGRIIPARAGFTDSHPLWLGRRADHPRSRGVYASPILPRSTTAGSSPLARGLPVAGPVLGDPRRIIPARAGFTRRRPPHQAGHQDHPRSRGVYSYSRLPLRKKIGSSPLARGLRWESGTASWVRGIIPARAGFTAASSATRPLIGDHPRSRGVYRCRPGTARTPPGSSPLARGLHVAYPPPAVPVGIIPARAGFTPGRG